MKILQPKNINEKNDEILYEQLQWFRLANKIKIQNYFITNVI